MNITGSKFVPGPQPKNSLAPQGADALYSGLLECPLTDKVTKTIPGGAGYNDTFAAEIFECSASAVTDQHLAGYKLETWPWPVHAFAASSFVSPPATEELNLFWNGETNDKGDHWLTFGAEQAANATAAGYKVVRSVGLAPTAANTAAKNAVYLHYSAQRNDHFTSAYPQPPSGYVSMGLQGYLLDSKQSPKGAVQLAWYYSSTEFDNVLAQYDGPKGNKPQSCTHATATADDCFAAAKAMDGIGNATVTTGQGASDTLATGCTVTYGASGTVSAYFNTKQTKVCCGDGVAELTGTAEALIGVGLTVSNASGVKITLSGPSNVWFGAGFFAQTMADAPYAIIVDGTGAVSERRMANHAIGTLLKSTVTVVSNTVSAGKRTIVVTRPASIPGTDHANFSTMALQVPFISAVGSSVALAYHKDKTASTLAMWPSAGQPVCLCSMPAAPFGSAAGTIKYLPTGEQFGFTNYCMPEPRESVLAQKNPTCDVRSYVGGLQVCKVCFSGDWHQPRHWDSPPAACRLVCAYESAHRLPTPCCTPKMAGACYTCVPSARSCAQLLTGTRRMLHAAAHVVSTRLGPGERRARAAVEEHAAHVLPKVQDLLPGLPAADGTKPSPRYHGAPGLGHRRCWRRC